MNFPKILSCIHNTNNHNNNINNLILNHKIHYLLNNSLLHLNIFNQQKIIRDLHHKIQSLNNTNNSQFTINK